MDRYKGDDKDPKDGLPVAIFILIAIIVLAVYAFTHK